MSNEAATPENNIRVLLVDDQRGVRRGLRMRLELEPDITIVGEADNGLSALSALDGLEPCVVVLDYEMPGMNGLEVAEELSESGRRCSIVMLTIHDTAALRTAAKSAGCHGFVAKQEPSDRLLAAIRSAGSDVIETQAY